MNRASGLDETPRLQAIRQVPFTIVWWVALTIPLFLSSPAVRPTWLFAAGVAIAGSGVIVLPISSVRSHPLIRVLPVVASCVAVTLLREATGGSYAGYGSTLVLIPVIWVGVYGRRIDLALTLSVVAATLVAPLVIFEGYPARVEVPRGLVLLLLAGALGVILQSLIGSLRANDDALTTLGAITRELHAAEDPRPVLCEAMRTLSGAPIALLLEVDDDGLVVSTSIGVDVPPHQIPADLDDPASRSLALGEIVFEPYADPYSLPVSPLPTGSRVHVPIARDGRPSAVLTGVWPTAQPELPRLVLGVLDLLRVDAGLALERTDLVAQLAHQAQQDGLTGLPNRRAWDDLLRREVARTIRHGRPLTLALLDLDRFKAFNDERGHLAGDDLLRGASEGWTAALRGADVIARWGGEEFALLLPDADIARALSVLQRLQQATPEGQTFSAGVVRFDPGHTPASLMAAADAALYDAKAAGRNRFVVARPSDAPAGRDERDTPVDQVATS